MLYVLLVLVTIDTERGLIQAVLNRSHDFQGIPIISQIAGF